MEGEPGCGSLLSLGDFCQGQGRIPGSQRYSITNDFYTQAMYLLLLKYYILYSGSKCSKKKKSTLIGVNLG